MSIVSKRNVSEKRINIEVFMTSFDVNSLFTNVPLDETIDIIVNKAFNNSALYNGFSTSQFRKLLCLSLKLFGRNLEN